MAKTLQRLYGEVMASDALKKEYFAAANEGKLDEFLSSHGCDATGEQLGEFLSNSKNLPQGEIADDELDSVAGGTCYHDGRPVVTVLNSCLLWTCGNCHRFTTDRNFMMNACPECNTDTFCCNCEYCRYENALWVCYHPERKNETNAPSVPRTLV